MESTTFCNFFTKSCNTVPLHENSHPHPSTLCILCLIFRFLTGNTGFFSFFQRISNGFFPFLYGQIPARFRGLFAFFTFGCAFASRKREFLHPSCFIPAFLEKMQSVLRCSTADILHLTVLSIIM